MGTIDFNGPLDFSNPETYLWLFFFVVALPVGVGAVLGIIAGIMDEFF